METLSTKNTSVLIAASADCGDLYGEDEERKNRFESRVRSSKSIVHRLIRERVRVPDPRINEVDDLQIQELKDAFDVASKGASSELPLDAFVFHYIGHGQLFNNQLYLYNKDTKASDPSERGIPISVIHDEIGRVPALVKIAIFDCCNSGAALVGLKHDTFPAKFVDERPELCGTYGIAAAPAGLPAWIPANYRETAFTKCMRDVLQNGIDNFEFLISLDDFFRSVRQLMNERQHGRVLRVSSVDDERIAICANPACAPENMSIEALEALKGLGMENRQEIQNLDTRLAQQRERIDEEIRRVSSLGKDLNTLERDFNDHCQTVKSDIRNLTDEIKQSRSRTFIMLVLVVLVMLAFAFLNRP